MIIYPTLVMHFLSSQTYRIRRWRLNFRLERIPRSIASLLLRILKIFRIIIQFITIFIKINFVLIQRNRELSSQDSHASSKQKSNFPEEILSSNFVENVLFLIISKFESVSALRFDRELGVNNKI